MKATEMKNWADRSNSNVLTGIDVSKIRLQRDRIIVRDLPENEVQKIGGIFLPDGDGKEKKGGVGKNGLLRLGEVVAVGPGDHLIGKGLDADGKERLAMVMADCSHCQGEGVVNSGWGGGEKTANGSEFPRYMVVACDENGENLKCPHCSGTGKVQATSQCYCKPGDVVVYDLRREAEFFIDGVRYGMLYEEASVLLILEDYGK